jgi:hypothetical protein
LLLLKRWADKEESKKEAAKAGYGSQRKNISR